MRIVGTVLLGAAMVVAAQARVGLDYRPNSVVVAVGQTVSINVFAQSTTGSNEPFSAVDVVSTWNPTFLNPIGYTNAGAGYAWGNSGFLFPTLNTSLTDGNAEWSGERQLFTPNPVATVAGLKLTQLTFTAVAPTTGTVVSMPTLFSGRRTRVFDPILPNTNILSGTDPGVLVTIYPAVQNLSGTLVLNDTIFGSGITRTIIGIVKQGGTPVGTITLSGLGSGSTNFSAALSNPLLGPATIEWDGSSFLRRISNISLTGFNQSIGTVSLVNGDVTQDGEVDAADIDAVIAVFGDVTGTEADCDVSGEVDAADIDIVIANFGQIDD